MPDQPEDPDACWPWAGAHESRMGYGQFTIDRGGSRWRTEMAHRVAFEIEHGRLPVGFVLHRCDNPPCVRPSHLYEGSHRRNMLDRQERGRTHRGPRANIQNVPRGSRHVRAKLDEAKVREIRSRYAAGGVSQQRLAEEYGVNQSKISNVVLRRTWDHVP